MTNAKYDSLAFSRDMIESGVPTKQAEIMARGTDRMLEEKLSQLVTRGEFNVAMSRIDQNFEAIDQRFNAIDQRFNAIDQRFNAIDQRLDKAERRLESLAELRSDVRLHTYMLGLIVLVLAVPQLQRWFLPA